MSNLLREDLGDYISIVCFKAAIAGIEEVLGEQATLITLTSAGRGRGRQLAQDLGLVSSAISWELMTDKLDFALGQNGTRLCLIKNIVESEGTITVYALETICSAGEVPGSSRRCTYTLGVIWGVLEQAIGKRLQGKHTTSILQDSNYDVFQFKVLA